MKKFCVIGHPISHSKSPALHEAGFIDLEIDAEFEAIDIKPENLETWIKQEFRPNFEGAAVTIPHKEEVRKYIDFETEAAKKAGAVNTLFWQEGILGGTNTDIIGILRAISTEINPEAKKVLILGAGGAARAAIYAMKSAKTQVYIWNRTFEKAKDLAKEFEITAIEDLEKIDPESVEIIMNLTSAGLKTRESIIPKVFWRSHHTAFDAIYTPLETKFLFEAEQAGATTITGDKMLIYQALEQFKIWHKKELEPEIMGNAFFNKQ